MTLLFALALTVACFVGAALGTMGEPREIVLGEKILEVRRTRGSESIPICRVAILPDETEARSTGRLILAYDGRTLRVDTALDSDGTLRSELLLRGASIGDPERTVVITGRRPACRKQDVIELLRARARVDRYGAIELANRIDAGDGVSVRVVSAHDARLLRRALASIGVLVRD